MILIGKVGAITWLKPGVHLHSVHSHLSFSCGGNSVGKCPVMVEMFKDLRRKSGNQLLWHAEEEELFSYLTTFAIPSSRC